MPNLTEEQWGQMTAAIDQLDNLNTALTVMTTVPDSVHVSCLRGALPEPLQQLKDVAAKIDQEVAAAVALPPAMVATGYRLDGGARHRGPRPPPPVSLG